MWLTPCVNRVPSTTGRTRSSSLLSGLRVATRTAAVAALVAAAPLHFQRDSEKTSRRDRHAAAGAARWLARGRLLVLHRGEVRVASAPARRHVQDIPDRPDRVDMAGIFALVPRREHQLGRPPVTEPVAVAREHVQDRALLTLWRFPVVVAVVVVVPRGQQPQVPPAAFMCEVTDPSRI